MKIFGQLWVLSWWMMASVAAGTEQLAVMQGLTGQSWTEVVVTSDVLPSPTDSDSGLHFELTAPGTTHSPDVEVKRWPAQTVGNYHLSFSGLRPGIDYRLTIRHSGRTVASRTLSTLPTDQPSARIAVASCMDDSYVRAMKVMWAQVQRDRPQLLFLIGDNVYADYRHGRPLVPMTSAVLWERYAETRLTLPIFQAQRLVPTFAIWDDHDYGFNSGDRRSPLKQQAKRVFEAFFGSRPTRTEVVRGPGISFAYHGFGQRFVFLDDRTFRSPPRVRPQTHFGDRQETWLYRLLARRQPTWLISGDQFFGAYHRWESFEGNHSRAFARFRTRVAALPSPVFFVSGDRHLAELMEISAQDIGHRTYELTTSGIHARMYPSSWHVTPNPRQIEGVANKLNYALVTSSVAANSWKLAVTARGEANATLFSRTLDLPVHPRASP